ncbi:MFS transporter [Parahaliea mediterranea]|uniref:MFS transporter n=1 Tax=Parahaliea mediterranea TaxID=651086 RepID=UPI000E2EE019|nr:MFS transporter [Parahaliea mediterranea]
MMPINNKTGRGLDINSAAALFGVIYLSTIGAAVFIVQPGFVQGLVSGFGLTEQQVGYVASAEMWGIALTTVALALSGHRTPAYRVTVASIILFVLGNLLSLLTTEPWLFTACRFLAGLGSGGLVSLTFTQVGLTDKPDRNFGFLIMGVLTYGALGLWVMPELIAAIGVEGLIVCFALFGASGLLFVRVVPATLGEHCVVEADAVDLPATGRGLAIGAMFTYFFAQGVIWAYLFLIGMNAGLQEQAVANGLMLSQFLGIAGALVAAVLGNRYGRAWPLAVGILGGALTLLWLLGPFSAVAYAVTVCLYNFAWNMTHPFLLGAMASFDRKGRVVSYAVAAQMLGLSVGPAFAASLLPVGGYRAVVLAGIGLFVASYLLILVPLLDHWRRLHRSASATA